VNIGKLGVLAYLAQIKGSGIIDGSFKLDGNLSDPQTFSGSTQLQLTKIQIDEQNLMGFQLDTMKVESGTIAGTISEGKVLIQDFKIGKIGTKDDLNITLTGDIALNRNVSSSALNLRTVFGISERVK